MFINNSFVRDLQHNHGHFRIKLFINEHYVRHSHSSMDFIPQNKKEIKKHILQNIHNNLFTNRWA